MMPTFVAVLTLMVPLWALAAWPQLDVPAGARVASVGEKLRLHGAPMRIQRVLTAQRPDAVARHYRAALGPRYATAQLQDRLVLSQGRDDYFITVSIRPLGPKLTEALVSIADAREARQAAGRPLGFNLPAASVVLSDIEADDAGKRSRQLVVGNAHAITTNIDVFTRELAARGMHADGPPLRRSAAEHVQFYKGEHREAQLIVMRRDGQTQTVLTMIEAQ